MVTIARKPKKIRGYLKYILADTKEKHNSQNAQITFSFLCKFTQLNRVQSVENSVGNVVKNLTMFEY